MDMQLRDRRDRQVALRPQRTWAGAVKQTLAYPQAHRPLARISKVAAHQREHAGESAPDRLARLANDWADDRAKAAAQLHTALDARVAKQQSRVLADAEVVCRVLAKTTLLWPAAQRRASHAQRESTRQGREEAVQERRAAAQVHAAQRALDRERRHASHRWCSVGRSRRCGRCLLVESADMEECAGESASLQAWTQLARGRGHRLLTGALHGDHALGDLPIVSCTACGAWTTAMGAPRFSKLLAPCTRRPTAAGAQVLARLERGVHPKPGRSPPLFEALFVHSGA